MNFFRIYFLVLVMSTLQVAHADLVIHGVEVGLAKFHRLDNKMHPREYATNNVWAPYVAPDDFNNSTPTPVIKPNADGSVTVIFRTLDELLNGMVQVSTQQNEKIAVLNINAHGLPGGMWFPSTQEEHDSKDCSDWRASTEGADTSIYNSYYSKMKKSEVKDIQALSTTLRGIMPCTVGLQNWQNEVKKIKKIKEHMASSLQVHLLSCSVGLGLRGQMYAQGIAELLFSKETQKIHTSTFLGLGDWSMSKGMGFWSYTTDEEFARFNAHYPVDRNDSDFAMLSPMRVSGVQKYKHGKKLKGASGYLENTDVMHVDFDPRSDQLVLSSEITNPALPYVTPSGSSSEPAVEIELFNDKALFDSGAVPFSVRVPGTDAVIELK